MNGFEVVAAFEEEVAKYCGAPYCVAVNSCTNALFLCLSWWRMHTTALIITIPKRTYISVPMQIIHAGYEVKFRDENWIGDYELRPTPIWDSARLFSSNMYIPGRLVCTSHHWSKTLGIQQGGCILLDDIDAVWWLKRARFDGRTQGVAPKDDNFNMIGWHMYMSPEVAAEGLVRLNYLPKHNDPLPNDDYPDLSQMELFK